MNKKFIAIFTIGMLCISSFSAEKIITLPAPGLKSGKPLMTTLSERQSKRDMSAFPLSKKELSEIFFAASGVNRKNGKFTIPTARDARDVVVFAAMPEGLYRYNPEKHQLELEQPRDLRPFTGMQQKMHTTAPVVLIFVSDYGKLKKVNIAEADSVKYAAFHAGCASQNVYLYAASAGMSTVICGAVDMERLASEMKIPESYRIQFTQPIGRK